MWYDVYIMLKTTFTSYKERFKEFMGILKPVIIIEIILLVLAIASGLSSDREMYVGIVLASLGLIVFAVIEWLIYASAAFRTIQKRELGEAITIHQAIAFQKTDKWNFAVLSFWAMLYTLAYLILSGAPIALGIIGGFALMGFGKIGLFAGTLIMIGGCACGLYLAYQNIPKIFFPLNIYFVKGKDPRECVEESVEIGKVHRDTIWKFIGGIVVINLIAFAFVIIPEFFNPQTLSEENITTGFDILNMTLQVVVGILFVTPMTYLYMSKAYAKMRAVTEPAIPHVVVTPESVQ